MSDIVHIPKKPLSNFVKYMWYQDGYQPLGQVEQVLPGGSSQIIINLDGNRFCHFRSDLKIKYEFDDVILSGVHSKPIFLDSSTRNATIGIVLKEGAIPALFKIPAMEFRNQVIPLEDLSMTNTIELKEKLYDFTEPMEKLQFLENYLYQLISSSFHANPAVNFAVAQIQQYHGEIDISGIVNKTGYTQRWFIKLFCDAVGITPKMFARIFRFQHAVDLLRSERTPNFSNVALQCGYYDQSHFIHEFRDFSGISPLDYHRNKGEEKNHLFMEQE